LNQLQDMFEKYRMVEEAQLEPYFYYAFFFF